MDARETGRRGEDLACRCLRRRGYRILARNFSCRQGEIDIVASKGDIVAFVEVKTRRSAAFAQAREFVTAAKQRRVIAAAQLWLAESGCALQPRFDVMEIYSGDGGESVELIENAFM